MALVPRTKSWWWGKKSFGELTIGIEQCVWSPAESPEMVERGPGEIDLETRQLSLNDMDIGISTGRQNWVGCLYSEIEKCHEGFGVLV
jgi:hypothetical protein